MSWAAVKAILFVIVFMIIIIGIGQYGWPIILGTISAIIIGIVYICVRIIVEYPKDDNP